MKTRFSSLDIACIVKEINDVLIGVRVNQIYDIDNKTFLIKFTASEKKYVLILESGNRIHLTTFDWPKNDHPSGFSMKLRKHLRNKRLEKIKQLGQDRIVDLEFGTGEVSFHVFIELFDKGNIILTDYQLNIVHLLRPHTEGNYKFLVREPYPLDRVKPVMDFNKDNFISALKSAADGELLKKLLIPYIDYGPSVAEHVLLVSGFKKGDKVKGNLSSDEIDNLVIHAEKEMMHIKELITSPAKGYIIKKKETKADGEVFFSNVEFQPYLFKQFSNENFAEYGNFNTAVDEFFSQMGTQKIDMKALQEEKAALKKVEKIKLDQAARLIDLDKKQLADATKAELLMCNVAKVDAAITAIRSAVAAQMPWNEISELVSEAHASKDPIGSLIKKLKLESNSITLLLHNPFSENDDDPGTLVDVDLELSAYANVKKYYTDKKFASNKQQKTIQAQSKVLKTAEKKVESVLKDIQTNASITKARTVFWFEKFLWFISSENFMIIGSRDKIQTELIIRRYMHEGDIFIHSDLPDASCFLIKNPSKGIVPPKTLNEAGTMVVCFSSAWEAHIISNAWWVHASQVSKNPHSGRGPAYFVAGEKNYLMPAQLAIGFGFIFYIDPSCVDRHENERAVKFNLQSLSEGDKNEIEEKDEVIEEKMEELCLGGDPVDEISSEESELKKESVDVSEGNTLDSDDGDDEVNILDNDSSSDDTDQEVENTRISESNSVDTKDISFDEPISKTVPKKNKKGDSPNKTEPSQKRQENNALKRGQRSKLKKIQEKYKDQDEEEKMLRMAILQSAGAKKESKKKSKHSKQEARVKTVPKPKVIDESSVKVEIDDTDVPVDTDLSMLSQLTGIPYQEDKIIFAMPIVAPYNTLIPYKYRVKMIPGTSKRGKSARSALNIFLNSKESSEQEKAVMKNVNDQILCRDLPGKIKLSIGQQAAKFKKKK